MLLLSGGDGAASLLRDVHELDHLIAAAGFEMVRYADDFVILCRSLDDAERALSQWPRISRS
jgi:RNA-directed DNA polymerase